ncbi:MAG: hypothetical protein KAI41_02805, partial [Hyphomicrobiaceae bacterium]|nr:hypothetical protein [Hyphomicrobiaceae bacterium]
MPTSNERIRDELLRHRIELQRFSDGLARRIRAILNRFEPELRARLKARLKREQRFGNPINATLQTKRYLGIARFIESMNDPMFKEIDTLVRTELVQLVKLEAATAHAIITGELPVIVNLSLPEART